MDPRQRLLRSVNWALGLSVFTLLVLVGGLIVSPATAPVLTAVQVREIENSRPPDTAPQVEQDAWRARVGEAGHAAYGAANRAFLVTTLYAGLPTTLLLVVVCILLYRVRVQVRRGV